MMKDTLGTPARNESKCCCWLCGCTPDRVHEVDALATWRQQFFDQWTVLFRCWQEKRHMSPIWKFPGFALPVLRLDWLRIVDLGVSADTAGNLLLLLQEKMQATTMSARLGELFKLIMEEYSNQGVTSDRLQTLTETLIRQSATSDPKLKAKGAETGRPAFPFSQIVGQQVCS